MADPTGNLKKDMYWAGIQFNGPLPEDVTIEEVYDCVIGAKPVTILPGAGIDMTCDYAKCVGEQVIVGF